MCDMLVHAHCLHIYQSTIRVLLLRFSRVGKKTNKWPTVCSVVYLHRPFLAMIACLRPFHTEYTGSHLITKVKQHWACSVLGWETAWEQ